MISLICLCIYIFIHGCGSFSDSSGPANFFEEGARARHSAVRFQQENRGEREKYFLKIHGQCLICHWLSPKSHGRRETRQTQIASIAGALFICGDGCCGTVVVVAEEEPLRSTPPPRATQRTPLTGRATRAAPSIKRPIDAPLVSMAEVTTTTLASLRAMCVVIWRMLAICGRLFSGDFNWLKSTMRVGST